MDDLKDNESYKTSAINLKRSRGSAKKELPPCLSFAGAGLHSFNGTAGETRKRNQLTKTNKQPERRKKQPNAGIGLSGPRE